MITSWKHYKEGYLFKAIGSLEIIALRVNTFVKHINNLI